MAEKCHLERQQHLSGTTQGIVGKRAITGGFAQCIEGHAKAGFGLLRGDRFVVSHEGVLAHAEHRD